MISIFAKKAEIDEQNNHMTGRQYAARSSLKLREWHVLATTCSLLRLSEASTPEYAIEGERPDFTTYWKDKTLAFPVEITEVLHPDYRRGDFWREREEPDAPEFISPLPELPNPWLPLREILLAKSGKAYPDGTCLFVYYDIGRFSFPDWHTPYEEQLFEEHCRDPFHGLDSFSRVLVLWADMKSLAQLHPHPKVIVPDSVI